MVPITVYALWDTEHKAFLENCGYYGNRHDVMCFDSRKAAENEKQTYYRGQPITVKRMRVK